LTPVLKEYLLQLMSNTKLRSRFCVPLLVAFATFMMGSVVYGSFATLPNGRYFIAAAAGHANDQGSKSGSLFLESDKIFRLPTAYLEQADNNGTVEFNITHVGNGYHTITANGQRLHEDGNTDRLISTRWGASDDFTLFRFLPNSDGTYRIQTKASGRLWNVSTTRRTVSTLDTSDQTSQAFRIQPTRSNDRRLYSYLKRGAAATKLVVELGPGRRATPDAATQQRLLQEVKTILPGYPDDQYLAYQQVFRSNVGPFNSSYVVLSSPTIVIVSIQGTAKIPQVGTVNLRPSETAQDRVTANTVNINEFINGRSGKGNLFGERTGVPMGCPSHLLTDDVLTHAGFSLAAQSVFPMLLTDLGLAGAGQKQVILCGHSQGGAVMTYVSYLIMRWAPNVLQSRNGPHYMVSFGGPDVSAVWAGMERFKTSFDQYARNANVQAYSVIVDGDPIPDAWRNSLTPAAPKIWAVQGRAVGSRRWAMQKNHRISIQTGYDGDLHWDWNSLPGQTVVERVGTTVALPNWQHPDPHDIGAYVLGLDKLHQRF
jgi:hypothetical protein